MADIPKVRIYHNSMWAKYKGAIFSQIEALRDSFGIKVDFIQVSETSDKRTALGPPDLSYHSYPHRLLFRGNSDHIPAYKLALALMRDVFRNKSQLVVIPGYHRLEYWAMLWTCIILRRKRAVFCDSTARENIKIPSKEIAKSFFFRHCQGFFCYGTRSKEYIQSYGIDPKLIYSPCQAAALPHAYDASSILRRYRASPRRDRESPTFLFVGRLSKEKGIEDLLAAFRSVQQQLPEAKLLLVGPGSERESLQSQAEAWGLQPSITFLGSQPQSRIGHLLESSTALVLPSRREPWGLVVNEALSYGCPVVVSEVCGCIPELVVDGVTGYAFPAGDVAALRDSMLRVISLNKNRLDTAKRCMEVISHYTPERAAAEILKGCNQILVGMAHDSVR